MRGQARHFGEPRTTQPTSPELEHWAPWGGFTRLRTEMDWPYTGLFDPIPCMIQSSSDFVPPVDLYETDTDVVLNAHLPGMSPEDFLVEVTGDILFLTGVLHPAVPDPATMIHRTEGGGRFDLRVRLPVEVDAGRVEATYRNGILEVRMPMLQAIPLRPVKISVTR
jgi:HSP20 family protein